MNSLKYKTYYFVIVHHIIINPEFKNILIFIYRSTQHMKDWSISSKQANTPVYLNVYSFCHCCNVIFGGIGLGVYHTAI